MRLLLVPLFWFGPGAACPLLADATGAFVPPQAYPPERYEAGWAKNPFTLKTAPVAMQKESFAKDLALGSMYEVGDAATVIVVNTKTRERTALRGQEPVAGGMVLKKAVIADTRKDSYAVVECQGEEATLRYDESFLKQMLAGSKAASPPEPEKKGEAGAPAAEKPQGPASPLRPPGGPPPGQPLAAAGASHPGGGVPGQPQRPGGFRMPSQGFVRPARPTLQGRRMGTAPVAPPGPATQPQPSKR